MNTLPPGHDPHDELDELYRRASDLDPSRPSEATRRTVLAHAERLAAARLTPPPRPRRRAGWWPAAFGTLAAGILAALLVVPSHLEPVAPPAPDLKSAAPAELTANTARAQKRLPAEPAPAGKAAAASDGERRGTEVPSEQAHNPSALVLQRTERPSARARAAPKPPEQLAERRVDSLVGGAPTQPPPTEAGAPVQSVVVTGGRVAAAPAAGAVAHDSQPEVPPEALHRAAAAGDVAAIEGLLAQATDVNARDSAGRTALLVAVLEGRGQAIATLLAHGADPNAADTAGVTPLAAALARGDAATVETLRRHGAR
jgi:hypothetical protein